MVKRTCAGTVEGASPCRLLERGVIPHSVALTPAGPSRGQMIALTGRDTRVTHGRAASNEKRDRWPGPCAASGSAPCHNQSPVAAMYATRAKGSPRQNPK
jgi:hypothetical protein